MAEVWESKDVALEALIDRAGRERVFEAARVLGWTPIFCPPAWVWQEIAWNILKAREAESAP